MAVFRSRSVMIMVMLSLIGSTISGEMNMDMHIEFPLVPRVATNLQTFTGALGGAVADPITNSGNSQRPFEVSGDTFPDFPTAGQRSCNNQHNACANLANANPKPSFTTGQCDTQQSSCLAAQNSATQTAFQVLKSQDANFDYFCDS